MFNRKDSNIYCIEYIINLAIQEALKILKTVLSKETEIYCIVYNSAILLFEFSKIDIVLVLYKLQYYIYIFWNRYIWKTVFESQYIVASIKYFKLLLDISVCWNSIYNIIKRIYSLQTLITVVYTIQDNNFSIKVLILT